MRSTTVSSQESNEKTDEMFDLQTTPSAQAFVLLKARHEAKAKREASNFEPALEGIIKRMVPKEPQQQAAINKDWQALSMATELEYCFFRKDHDFGVRIFTKEEIKGTAIKRVAELLSSVIQGDLKALQSYLGAPEQLPKKFTKRLGILLLIRTSVSLPIDPGRPEKRTLLEAALSCQDIEIAAYLMACFNVLIKRQKADDPPINWTEEEAEKKINWAAEEEKQIRNIFPNGHVPNVEEQEGYDFEPLLSILNEASKEELDAVLSHNWLAEDYVPYEGNALDQELHKFRAHFNPANHKGYYNPRPLKDAYGILAVRDIRDNWDSGIKEAKLNVWWTLVIGYLQRQLPARHQFACHSGFATVAADPTKLSREYRLADFFTLDSSSLGFTFSWYSCHGGSYTLSLARGACAHAGARVFLVNFLQQTHSRLEDFLQTTFPTLGSDPRP